MNTVFLILLLVAAVVAANALFTKFNVIPAAFVQIAAGLILSLFPIYKNFHLEPEVFLLVIISMLMFNDGQHTSLGRLTRSFGTTFSLAVELSVVSIVIVGFLTHLLIPSLSLALAFALGSIITPTDAVAVSSITNKVMVPTEVMNTLENESLFNDASGIVAMNLPIAAAVTGKFSVWHGLGDFFFVFFGGIVVGAILGAIIVQIRIRLINNRVDMPSVIVPFTLLTPFVVYLSAEALGVSGILAVVVTGLFHGVQQNKLRLTTSSLQIVMSSTWNIISTILNGIVFVLLGLSLPSVIASLRSRGTSSVAILIGVGILLYVVMTVLRYLWTRFDLARIRAWDKHDKNSNSIVLALSGVHGTITLAMAFSLPFTLNGRPFTYRTDMIFIASVVIITSLLVPTVILPLMLPKQVSKVSEVAIADAKGSMVTHAIQLIKTKYGNTAAASQVINILDGQRTVDGKLNKNKLDKLFEGCFNAEQLAIDKNLADGKITSQYADLYMNVAQRTMMHYQQNGFQKFKFVFKFRIGQRLSLSEDARRKRKEFKKMKPNGMSKEELIRRNRSMWTKMRSVEEIPYSNVIDYLNKNTTEDNAKEVSVARRAYDERHRRLSGQGESMQDEQNELLIEAFQQEYNFIQNQVARKVFDRELGNALYEQISTDQLVYLQSVNDD
ncbi:cation:proton antiporter [Companilactobacillus mishanensis]|uniref:cation:proton antiporter n=1 Tax=Companilactobacillus mishanensis TaxID=2486008 RepID=UPI000F78DA28|nr:sodium:proton antiporter [Companilactobacillus mishanensis]